MKRFALLFVLVGFGLGACDRHEFDGPNGTRQLHPDHHAEKTSESNAEENDQDLH